MAKKKTRPGPDLAIVELDADCEVTLPDWVRNDPRVLRWLFHRLVDLQASHKRTRWMIQDVEDRLAAMCSDLLDDTINGLLVEARARQEEAARG